MTAAHFEAKKHAYRQTQDGIVISFVVHPNDVAAALATAPLGTRYMVAFAEIGEDEQPATDKPAAPAQQRESPEKGKRRFDEMPRSQQAALMCDRADFQTWCGVSNDDSAAKYVRERCRVTSRAHLDTEEMAAGRWDSMLMQFRGDMNLMAEQRG